MQFVSAESAGSRPEDVALAQAAAGRAAEALDNVAHRAAPFDRQQAAGRTALLVSQMSTG
jgi:hypothetical protein